MQNHRENATLFSCGFGPVQGLNCEKLTGRVSNTAGIKGLGEVGSQWNEQRNWGLNPTTPVNSNPGPVE